MTAKPSTMTWIRAGGGKNAHLSKPIDPHLMNSTLFPAGQNS
jgi:hypothetical protein